MKWNHFIEQIRSIGYEGPDDDLSKVKSWLKANGHNDEQVAGSDGETYELKQLYEDRPGKLLDCSKAEREAREEERVQKLVEERIAGLEEAMGTRKRERGSSNKAHDVTVGKDRLADNPTGGFKHAGDFYKAVQAGCVGDTPEPLGMWHKATLSTYGNVDAGADGGFAVPTDYRNEIMKIIEGEDSVLARCTQVPLDGNSVTMVSDETTPWQTSGGILAYWGSEAGSMSQSKPNLQTKEWKLRKVYALVPVTEELLEDSSALGAWLPMKAGEKLDFKVGEAIFRGTGAGQPLGFLNSGGLISVAEENGQANDTVLAGNVIKMWQRLYAPYRRAAVWYISPDIETELARLTLVGRNASGNTSTFPTSMVYVPPGGASGSPYGTLMGRPVIVTQHCSAIGDVGDICLCAMNKYICAVKSGGVQSSSSMHLWFDQDTTAFKFRMRVDGQPELDSPITPRAGSTTLSAFVTVAAR